MRILVCSLLLLAFLSNALPCGPGYISPLFETSTFAEEPYTEYAAGRLGIVKNSYRRSVLLPAYRYIAGGGLNASEQKAMIEVWNAQVDYTPFPDNSIDDAVKAWVARRKDVVGPDEKTPEIYAERSYGGYEFFPNCTRNAFETATETLADRISAHGPQDPGVEDWLKAQDQVFLNCSTGKRTPADAPTGSAQWLQKDRAYQKAAAEFYSLNYESAKQHFAEIAADSDSPWAETADYLVARTLIRQASVSKSADKTTAFYDQAEQRLRSFTSRTGKFTASAERMLGLISYRNHPQQRVGELARILMGYGSNDDFRQSVIDYTWLLDKFEYELVDAESKRKELEKHANGTTDDDAIYTKAANALAKIDGADVTVEVFEGALTLTGTIDKALLPRVMASVSASGAKHVYNKMSVDDPEKDDVPDGYLKFQMWTEDYNKSFTVLIRSDATDADTIAAAEKAAGVVLNDDMKKRVVAQRQDAYAEQYKLSTKSSYEGGYGGDEKLTPALLPDFLRRDELTEWMFVFQMPAADSYAYSLQKYKDNGGDLWLMTAISKASKDSPGVSRLLEDAARANRNSPAFTTIAYHAARILIEQNKAAEARKMIDENLALDDQIPLSSRNSFLQLKLKLATNIDEYILASLRKPYAFDFDGKVGSVDTFIAEEKKWYDPETDKQTREQYDAEVEDRFTSEKMWQGREMFDSDVIQALNQHLTTSKLLEVEQSPALPDYMRERFAMAIWMRSYLVNDAVTMAKIAPEFAKRSPAFADQLAAIAAAKTPAAKNTATLYFILKNPILSPYLEEGMGKADNEQDDWDFNNWWCEPYDDGENTYDSAGNTIDVLPRPPFVTVAQDNLAKGERAKLKEIGDAPKFLADKTMAWAKAMPADKRVPEALYIVIRATGWNKYGCGTDNDLHDEIVTYLKTQYPNSEWTKKLDADQADQ